MKNQELQKAEDTYDATDDAWKSVEEAYRVIKERIANGGPGWEPKALTQTTEPVQLVFDLN